jgi:hypothetical protein
MSVNLTNTDDYTPRNISAGRGNVEATNALVERYAVLKDAKNMMSLH